MSAVQVQTQPATTITRTQLEAQRPAATINQKKHMILACSITSVVIGSLCIVLGAISLSYSNHARIRYYSSYGYSQGYSYDYYNTFSFTFGQGIWCGIWVLVAGVLGVRASGETATRCVINAHVGFAIFGSLTSGVLFIIDLLGITKAYESDFFLGLSLSSMTASVISMTTLTLSACYSYGINKNNGGGEEIYTGDNRAQQMVCVGNQLPQQQQPIIIQGQMNHSEQYNVTQPAPGTQMYVQGYVPVQAAGTQMMQPIFAPMQQVPIAGQSNIIVTTTPQPQSTASACQLNQDQMQDTQPQIESDFPSQAEKDSTMPPAYSE